MTRSECGLPNVKQAEITNEMMLESLRVLTKELGCFKLKQQLVHIEDTINYMNLLEGWVTGQRAVLLEQVNEFTDIVEKIK